MLRIRKANAPLTLILVLLAALLLSACNLSSSDATQEIDLTLAASSTPQPTRTTAGTGSAPTTLPLPTTVITPGRPTPIVIIPPTSIVSLPTFTPLPLPVNIAILSPIPGNVVSGNVQVLGAATHPQFLQYQLEFGPDPNPGNLWFPATSPIQTPVLNGLLGIWNTTSTQDALYQLRVRVYLRDGSTLTTFVNNIRVQNQVPTPIPTVTQNIPRPIAAFTQNQTTGQAPLNVQFTNQSSGNITNILWNFGDGATSNQANPQHIFASPGLYNVTLTVTGPGGSSNVTRQISAQSATPPVAGFTQNPNSGFATLTVQFTNTSTGAITNYLWNFSDGTTSDQPNPVHSFAIPGTYNIFLTVSGPGGSSSVTRQLTVLSSATATPTNTPITPTLTNTSAPPTDTPITPTITNTPETPALTLTDNPTDTATGVPPTETFTDTPTETSTLVPPTDTPTETPTDTLVPPTDTPTETPTETLPPPTDTPTETPTETLPPPTDTPTDTPTVESIVVNFSYQQHDGLNVGFTNLSTGPVTAYAWDFGDGGVSNDANPTHLYPAGGQYLVRLTAFDVNNNPTVSEQLIQVNEPVIAAFTPQINGLDVTFTNQSMGQIASYQWDFGDGAISTEFEPIHTYVSGTYLVTLTVVGQDGISTDSTSQEVVIESQSIDPGLAGTTPIFPNLGNNLRGIYDYGISIGNRATVFTYTGDQTLIQQGVLDPFAPGGTYDLGSRGNLQAIIDWYNLTDLGGVTSFTRESFAARNGWRIEDLLNPANNPPGCEGYNSPFVCELDQANASVILINIGYNDVLAGTDMGIFRTNLETVVQASIDAGVIPVLFTVRPSSDGGVNEQQTRLINDAIIEVATNRNVPVVNLWFAIHNQPGDGQDNSGNLTVSPNGGGDLSDGAIENYGVSVVNTASLRILSDLRNTVFPDAAAP